MTTTPPKQQLTPTLEDIAQRQAQDLKAMPIFKAEAYYGNLMRYYRALGQEYDVRSAEKSITTVMRERGYL